MIEFEMPDPHRGGLAEVLVRTTALVLLLLVGVASGALFGPGKVSP